MGPTDPPLSPMAFGSFLACEIYLKNKDRVICAVVTHIHTEHITAIAATKENPQRPNLSHDNRSPSGWHCLPHPQCSPRAAVPHTFHSLLCSKPTPTLTCNPPPELRALLHSSRTPAPASIPKSSHHSLPSQSSGSNVSPANFILTVPLLS